jgi:Fe-S cluster assembly protein SufD
VSTAGDVDSGQRYGMFTAERSARLGGPRWLVDRRRAAAAGLAEMVLPDESLEEWRYSRIGDLELAAYEPTGAPGEAGTEGVVAIPGSGTDTEGIVAMLGARSALVRTFGGVVGSVDVSAAAAALGVSVERAGDLASEPPLLGEVLDRRADALTRLADAFCSDVVVCRVPADVQLSAPIVIVHDCGGNSGAPGGLAVFPRTLVEVGARAEASVVEIFLSGDRPCLVVPVTELELGDAAHLSYTSVQELGRDAWHLGYQSSRVGRDSTLRSFVAALGGAYARQLTNSTIAGDNGASELLAVYLGDGDQVQDMRTFQEHIAPRTRSELVFKGAVAERSRSVYTGTIHMHPGARKANASQTNRNLVLSREAHADSVPNLDIEENDVRCSHASAVGPVDADQLFYLGSRGVPPDVAEQLVLLGFFDDLLQRAAVPGIADHLREVVAARLAASLQRDRLQPGVESSREGLVESDARSAS